jgi:hypothetical protein
MNQEARTALDRELARWLAAALVNDYLQGAARAATALDIDATDGYQNLCSAPNGGERRPGPSTRVPTRRAAPATPLLDSLAPAASATRSSSGNEGLNQ